MDFIKAIEYGSGITRIINLLHEAKLPSPQIEEISDGFRITIFATPKVADKVAIKVADKNSLTEAENQILKFVKTNQAVALKTSCKRLFFPTAM